MKHFLKFFLVFAVVVSLSAALYDTPYIGNSNTMKFHYPNCNAVAKINPSHQVGINSREEAVTAGYVPCKKCNP